MRKNYRTLLPSGDSQSEQPKKENPTFYDPNNYQQRVATVTEGRLLEDAVGQAINLLQSQLQQLQAIPMDTQRNNRSKVLNQNVDIAPVVEQNAQTALVLATVAKAIHGSDLMNRYIDQLTRDERERWQLTEIDKAKIDGGNEAVEHIKKKGDEMIQLLQKRAEYHPLWAKAIDRATMLSMFGLLLWFGKTAYNPLSGTAIFIATLIVAFPYVVRGVEMIFSKLTKK